jgi:hypothetical protein
LFPLPFSVLISKYNRSSLLKSEFGIIIAVTADGRKTAYNKSITWQFKYLPGLECLLWGIGKYITGYGSKPLDFSMLSDYRMDT